MPVSIPEFPVFREPLVTDSETFHALAKQSQPVVSELTFTNVFVWRGAYNFRMSMHNGNLCILADRRDEPPFFLPPLGINNLADTYKTLIEFMSGQGYEPLFSRVPEVEVNRIKEWAPEVFVEEDRANADYVYLSSDLADLPGRKYHKKRNHIARFNEMYTCEYRRLTPDLIHAVREFQNHWCDVRGCFTPEHIGLAVEHAAIVETVDNFEELRVVGGVLMVDGGLAGFTIGEELNDDTFVIHFEKANQEYQGAYQALNQLFCQDVCRSYTYVNREQDLGEQGLRQAKKSYYPDHMVMKYNVRLKGGQ